MLHLFTRSKDKDKNIEEDAYGIKRKLEKGNLFLILLGLFTCVITRATIQRFYVSKRAQGITKLSLSSSSSSINELNNIITNYTNQLQNVTRWIKNTEDTLSNFCPNCQINVINITITCQQRLEYIVQKHDDQENDIKEVLKMIHPQCNTNHTEDSNVEVELHTSDEDKILGFCEECAVKITGEYKHYKISCGERKDYIITKYHHVENIVKAELYDDHPECYKKVIYCPDCNIKRYVNGIFYKQPCQGHLNFIIKRYEEDGTNIIFRREFMLRHPTCKDFVFDENRNVKATIKKKKKIAVEEEEDIVKVDTMLDQAVQTKPEKKTKKKKGTWKKGYYKDKEGNWQKEGYWKDKNGNLHKEGDEDANKVVKTSKERSVDKKKVIDNANKVETPEKKDVERKNAPNL